MRPSIEEGGVSGVEGWGFFGGDGWWEWLWMVGLSRRQGEEGRWVRLGRGIEMQRGGGIVETDRAMLQQASYTPNTHRDVHASCSAQLTSKRTLSPITHRTPSHISHHTSD